MKMVNKDVNDSPVVSLILTCNILFVAEQALFGASPRLVIKPF
jgi:hypothetical protein